MWGLGKAVDASDEGRQAGSKDALCEVRFAFYGCVGASDPEEPEVSEAWQREMAEHKIAGRGCDRGGLLRCRGGVARVVVRASAGVGVARGVR